MSFFPQTPNDVDSRLDPCQDVPEYRRLVCSSGGCETSDLQEGDTEGSFYI
ncbi:Hypothetical protein SMAX5B_002096 [Scophthalmus maximus]|uniref:Uncharacterized protein n=1 Tax=Scophthalmus maximus TaxID=52904 RepID=A0A2U9CWT1_SCOMX|nr:Hypothetical protein SMAX5B_002096 [Scophthalmus maximus]